MPETVSIGVLAMPATQRPGFTQPIDPHCVVESSEMSHAPGKSAHDPP